MVDFSAELGVQSLYFDLIKKGMKTVEGRIAKDKYRRLCPGEIIRFYDQDHNQNKEIKIQGLNFLEAHIISIEYFTSFSQMLTYYGVKNCLPGVKNLEKALEIYHSFPGYQSEAEKLGVLGIEIKIVN